MIVALIVIGILNLLFLISLYLRVINVEKKIEKYVGPAPKPEGMSEANPAGANIRHIRYLLERSK